MRAALQRAWEARLLGCRARPGPALGKEPMHARLCAGMLWHHDRLPAARIALSSGPPARTHPQLIFA